MITIYKIPYYLTKKVSRKLKLFKNKNFNKTTKDKLNSKFISIGLKSGMNLYVHSSLSSFGYIENGANTVIEVLKSINKNGTIMMPAFTHPKKDFTLNEPCWTGKIAETFRKEKNVKRSIHPTHSVACYGKFASHLVKDHEKCKAPFDENSPFAKFSSLNNSYILMLGTENNSMIHYIQNKINFPNLFLSKIYTFKFKDKIIKTKLHHPEGAITYIYKAKKCTDVEFLINLYRNEKFEERSLMKTIKIGNATCHLIKTREFVDTTIKYLENNIKRYKKGYSLILKDETN